MQVTRLGISGYSQLLYGFEQVEVTTNSQALELTTYQASVTTGGATNVDVALGSLVLSTNQAEVDLDVNVSSSTELLTLTTNQASITYNKDVQVNLASLLLDPYQANVVTEVYTGPLSAVLALTPMLSATIALTPMLSATIELTPELTGTLELEPE